MADLTGQQLKNSYQNLVTIDATIESNPTSGQLENGLGNPITALGIGTDAPTRTFQVHEGSATSSGIKISNSTTGATVDDGFDLVVDSVGNAYMAQKEALPLIFLTSDSEAMRIDSSGNVGIGTAPDTNLHVKSASSTPTARIESTHPSGIPFFDLKGAASSQIRYIDETGTIQTRMDFSDNGGISFVDVAGSASTRMKIDTSGNVLVGTTSDEGDNGITLGTDGRLYAAVTSSQSIFNRLSTDGDIVRLKKDGSTVGSIGTSVGSTYIGGSGDGAIYFNGTADIRPWNKSTQANLDNSIDLGVSSARFQDIYASNGTIQTSDRNEKQDIEQLNDAELRVAQKAKTLLRKFRWKSSVEEKENARIHFGIIAQDLEQAFIDEGLDAGRYGMFIKSTWTNEEGEEQTRLGVRYNQLLAFIISAL